MKPIVCLIFTLAFFPIHAEYLPPDGAEIFYDLYSPYFLSGGDTSTMPVSPVADSINPAASAWEERPVLDLSYSGIPGLGDVEGFGSSINAGLSFPLDFGVLSAGIHYLASPFGIVDLGKLLAADFSISKRLSSSFSVGAGLGVVLGSNDNFDLGLGLDIGFLHMPGDIGFLKDFKWALTVRDLGKGYSPVPDKSGFPAPFTPSIAVSFLLLHLENLSFGLNSAFEFPSFQSFRMNIGAEVNVGKFLTVRGGWPIDLYEWTNDRKRLPAFGLTFHVPVGPERDGGKDRLDLGMAAAPLVSDIWAFSAGVNMPLGGVDTTAPVVTFGETLDYISPNMDGVQDQLVIPFKTKDRGYILGYRFVVEDADGSIVREIRNKEEAEEEPEGLMGRLLYVKHGISVPELLRWDGRNDSGAPVQDGEYRYRIEAWDDAENHGVSEIRNIILDKTPPEADVETDETAFSPNADGSRDVVVIQQRGSVEELWIGEILDSDGNPIKKLEWRAQSPAILEWDGTNDDGVTVMDGIYSYRLGARDRAGNEVAVEVSGIVVDTETTPVSLIINSSHISPNGDGRMENLSLTINVPNREDIGRWEIRIFDEEGAVHRSIPGSGAPPPRFVFDGRNSQGIMLGEGDYKAAIDILYLNGNHPVVESPVFHLDMTSPSARISVNNRVFSPNGDGRLDTITFSQNTSEENQWVGRIQSSDGRIIIERKWQGRAAPEWIWDGRDSKGLLVADGEYVYQITSTDRAGNRGESNPEVFKIDTEETPLILTVNTLGFSPNNDGRFDKLVFIPQVKVTDGISEYDLGIRDSAGNTVRSLSGSGSVPESLSWERAIEMMPLV